MNDADRLQELIDGHLDDTLDAAARAELDRRLAADPEAARRFVRAARQDNALYLYYHRLSAEALAAAAFAQAARAAETAPAPAVAAREEREAAVRAPPAARPRWTRVVDHLWGPLGAVLAHAALLLILIRWVVLPITRPTAPVEIAMQTAEPLTLDTPSGAKAPRFAPAVGLPPLEAPTVGVTAPDVMPDVAEPPSLAQPPEAIAARPGRLWGEPEWMRGRRPPEREARLARYAPEWLARTEPALDGAIRWLLAVRREDGLWSAPGVGTADPALTATVIAAFLARGEPLTGVQDAISWLIDIQQPDGVIASINELDAQGVAACALIEAYARAPLPPLRLAAERAVERLLAEQTPAGLWPDETPWSTSWRALALRTAAWAGLDVPGLQPGLARLVGGLKTLEDPAGLLFRGPRPASRDIERVAATALALQWLGEGRSPEARAALAALGRVRLDDAANPPGEFALHLIAQARFNEGEEAWARAREAIAGALLQGRAADGGWRADGAPPGARVQATALAALSLTVCYRFPPASEWPPYAAQVSRAAPLIAAARRAP